MLKLQLYMQLLWNVFQAEITIVHAGFYGMFFILKLQLYMQFLWYVFHVEITIVRAVFMVYFSY
jgi:hypothetical protein